MKVTESRCWSWKLKLNVTETVRKSNEMCSDQVCMKRKNWWYKTQLIIIQETWEYDHIVAQCIWTYIRKWHKVIVLVNMHSVSEGGERTSQLIHHQWNVHFLCCLFCIWAKSPSWSVSVETCLSQSLTHCLHDKCSFLFTSLSWTDTFSLMSFIVKTVITSFGVFVLDDIYRV